jgi:DNA-directed RNA polymerase subunit RPC12/RpoP
MIKYACRSCGFELFRFEKVGQDFYGVRTPTEVMGMYSNKCPRCGNRLKTPSNTEIILSLRRAKDSLKSSVPTLRTQITVT